MEGALGFTLSLLLGQISTNRHSMGVPVRDHQQEDQQVWQEGRTAKLRLDVRRKQGQLRRLVWSHPERVDTMPMTEVPMQ